MVELNIENNTCSWIPFYQELADKLLDFKENRAGLLELVYNPAISEYTKYLYENDGTRYEDFDPFSLYAIFNKSGLSDEQRSSVCSFLKDQLQMTADVPGDYYGIPVVLPLKATFFYRKEERGKSDIENIWIFFQAALSDDEDTFKSYFDVLEKQLGIRWNLTMGLFWIRPNKYLSLDGVNQDYLTSRYNFPVFNAVPSGEEYLALVKSVAMKMNDNIIVERSFPMFSHVAFSNTAHRIWLVGYVVDDVNRLDEFLKNNIWKGFMSYDDKSQVNLLKSIKIDDYLVLKSSSTKGTQHDKPFVRIQAVGKVLSTEVINEKPGVFGIQCEVQYIDNTSKDFDGSHYGKYRKTIHELKDYQIMEYVRSVIAANKPIVHEPISKYEKYVNSLKPNFNLILTGAPGTGKTYLAKKIAEAMNAETEFVQFHPSYDYTDFVEGLRPTKPDSGTDIGFVRTDGVFKSFCKRALQNLINSAKTEDEISNEISIQDKVNDFLFNATDQAKHFHTKTGTDFYISSFTDDRVNIAIPSNAVSSNISINVEDIINLLKNNVKLENVRDIRAYFQKQFNTQQDSYTFVICNEIRKEKDVEAKNDVKKIVKRDYVFIIDEINRGEISKIFGELFFAIDPSYRGERGLVKTQYQNLVDDGLFKDGFYVPENVYIIGTMNDIDRSVESMDFAMRRRFTWIEVKAEDRIEMWDDPDDGIAEWKDEAHKRMSALNDAIEKVEGLSSAYDIGPAYFLKLKQCNGDFNQLWEYNLEGLLKEYLRGMPNADKKLEALHNAYNQKEEGKQSGPAQPEQPVEAEGK